MVQLLREPAGKDLSKIYCLQTERDSWPKMGRYLGHRDHEIVEFEITGEKRKAVSKTFALSMGTEGFGLLKELVNKVPGNPALKLLMSINAGYFLRDIC